MAPKVAENLAALRAMGLPAAEIKVLPRVLYPGYFADRSPVIARPLSFVLFNKLKQLGLANSTGFIAVEPKNVVWNAFRSYLSSDLQTEIAKLPPAQQLETDVRVVDAHIWECISLAWGRHETIGEYLTAVLAWLEGGGKGSIGLLARRLRVAFPATLTVPAGRRQQRRRRFRRQS
ncbi:hypothetical protein ABPG75_010054 [Micractinium tetrahymenae]